MNFGMLKNMVENLVSSYKCPFCGWQDISEKNIDIIGAAGNTVNIDMHCPSCKRHFMAKTEVMHIEIWNIWQNKVDQIQKALMALKWKLWGNLEIEADFKKDKKDQQQILDENIINLRENMKTKGFNARDLFTEE